MRSLFYAALAAAAAAIPAAHAQADPPLLDRYQVTRPKVTLPEQCSFSQPAQRIDTLKALPAVAREFERQKLVVADVGEPFIPYDVSEGIHPLPHRQFLRAYVFPTRTIVWYYHGGLATHLHMIELRMKQDTYEPQPVLHLTGTNLSGPPCQATQAILDGVMNFDGNINDW